MASGSDGGQFILEYKLTVPVVLPLDVSDSFLKGTTLMSLNSEKHMAGIWILSYDNVAESKGPNIGQTLDSPRNWLIRAESDVIASCPATAGQGALSEEMTGESKAIEHARRCKEATIACGLQRFQGLLVPFLPSGPRLSGTHLFATLLGHKQAKEIN
uniref:Uncharacterized protein n=1 Tax=Oryza nivara TaxID=4536 RepID=A0A0E0GGV0_ORYNI